MENEKELKQLIFLYAIMKRLVSEVTNAQRVKIKNILNEKPSFAEFKIHLQKIITKELKLNKLLSLYDFFEGDVDTIAQTVLALQYLKFKDFILLKKNTDRPFQLIDETIQKKFENLGVKGPSYKLTSAYDQLSALAPYADRVYSAWILNTKAHKEAGKVSGDVQNNVFQVILDESIRQSGISSSGGDYESRLEELFIFCKLEIKKHHHELEDESQEHDFLLTYQGKSIGVSAKRTLRERYKQYNPKEVQLALVFTIGDDLNETKANIITEKYKLHLFVADEFYNQNSYLQSNQMVHKVTSFSQSLLNQLIGGSH